MSPEVLGLVLGAAVIHASWNLLLGRAADSQAATAVALVAGVLIFVPVALAGGHVHRGAVPYLIASNALELGYFALLARGYDTGRASAVYPVARGSAPVLVLVLSVVLGRPVGGAGVAGVVLVAGGVVVLGLSPGLNRAGLLLGLATGCCIAGYTLVDSDGLRHADPLPYLECAMTVPALAYSLFSTRRKGWPAVRASVSVPAVLAGVGVFAAYSLALAALARGAAAPVAAVRETGIVFLTVMSAVLLREHVSARQWLGALVVTGGVIVIALG